MRMNEMNEKIRNTPIIELIILNKNCEFPSLIEKISKKYEGKRNYEINNNIVFLQISGNIYIIFFNEMNDIN